MKVLVTGASGMLGKDVSAACHREGWNVSGIFRTPLSHAVKFPGNVFNIDLTNNKDLAKLLADLKPDLIIHCAAAVNVDACEENKKYADALHVRSTEILAAATKRIVYVSTDSVFDGEKGNYAETDVPAPLNYYAETKLEGEKKALANLNSIVLRTNIYGFHHTEMPSLAEWALGNLRNNKSIGGFTDVFFNPLYTAQLADVIIALVKKEYKGVLNAASDPFISKYLFLVKLAETFGYPASLVEEKSISDISFKAKRPNNTTLNFSKQEEILGAAPTLSEGLEMFKRDYTHNMAYKA
jgi:dTDP-4-dehydrorhamnose reductase